MYNEVIRERHSMLERMIIEHETVTQQLFEEGDLLAVIKIRCEPKLRDE